jgi:hypothetical protein
MAIVRTPIEPLQRTDQVLLRERVLPKNRLVIRLPIGVAVAVVFACSSSMQQPAAHAHAEEEYDVVPYPPPSALVEVVPESPRPDAVWVDGYWIWRGRYYVWERGGWVVPPKGAYVSNWNARYRPEGALLYAPTTWHAANGQTMDAPEFLQPAATPPTQETAEPSTVP